MSAGTQRLPFMRVTAVPKGVGFWHSLWKVAGFPGAGATPPSGVGEVATSALAGALSPLVDAQSGHSNRFAGLKAAGTLIGSLLMYDRLVHTSGLSGTASGAQTVNSAAVTRPSTGHGDELWLECYTATGSSAANVTATYTNSDGATGRVTPSVAFWQTPVAGQMMQLPLQSGDRGVRSVQTLTISATTGTAGDFGVTLLRKMAFVPLLLSDVAAEDLPPRSAVRAYDLACIAFAVLAGDASGTGQTHGLVDLEEV